MTIMLKPGIRALLRPFKSAVLAVADRVVPPYVRSEVQKRTNLHFVPIRFYPKYRENFWIITKQQPETDVEESTGLPIPPSTHWRGYGATSEKFLELGKRSMTAMMATLERSGYTLQPGDRVLDLGCAAGRVLRHFEPWAGKCELWGADPDHRLIEWCQLHMGPHYKFLTSTTFPHLPFEDNYFNLIYAHSVFTHICDLPETWLMELRRILKPGGRIYLTIADEFVVDYFLNSAPDDTRYKKGAVTEYLRQQIAARPDGLPEDWQMISWRHDMLDDQVFYHTEFLRRFWGPYVDILDIARQDENKQTAIVATKP